MISHRGKFIKLFKRVTLKEFKTHYKINKTSRIVGWTPDYVGASRSKYVCKPNIIGETVIKSTQKTNIFSKDFIKDCSQSVINHRVVYSAGFDTVHDHLSTMISDNTTSISVNEIFDILAKSDFKWFVAPNVNFSDSSEIDVLIRVNNNAFSGHYTNLITHGNKGTVDITSREIAKKIYEILKIKPQKNVYLWEILGREKDIKVNYSDTIKEVGTRAVWCCESAPTTLLMWFAQKMSFVVNKGKWDKTYNILDEFTHEKARKINDRSINYDWCLEADWSKFDSNIDSNFLIAASLIITSGLNSNIKLNRNISYYITKSILTKYVVIPPGVVIEVNRGQPSGHPFGTFVNCNVNLIYWSLIGYKIYGDDYASKMSVEVYGDDTFAYFKDSPKLKQIDQFISELGLKSEKLSDKFTRVGIDLDLCERPDFLKRRFNEINIVWNHKKMCDRLLYQTRNRSVDEQLELLYGYVNTCPNDEDLKLLVGLINDKIKNNEKIFNSIDNENNRGIILRNNISEVSSVIKAKVRSSSVFRSIESFDSFKTEMDIMKWGVFRYKRVKNVFQFLNDINKKYHDVLFLIGFNIGELKRKDKDIDLLGNKSPPDVNENDMLDKVKAHFGFANKKMDDYFNRRFKRDDTFRISENEWLFRF